MRDIRLAEPNFRERIDYGGQPPLQDHYATPPNAEEALGEAFRKSWRKASPSPWGRVWRIRNRKKRVCQHRW